MQAEIQEVCALRAQQKRKVSEKCETCKGWVFCQVQVNYPTMAHCIASF